MGTRHEKIKTLAHLAFTRLMSYPASNNTLDAPSLADRAGLVNKPSGLDDRKVISHRLGETQTIEVRPICS